MPPQFDFCPAESPASSAIAPAAYGGRELDDVPLLAAVDAGVGPAPSCVREHVNFVLLSAYKHVLGPRHPPPSPSANGASGKVEFLLGPYTQDDDDAFHIEGCDDDGDRVHLVLRVRNSEPLGRIVPLADLLLLRDGAPHLRRERSALLDPEGLNSALEADNDGLRVLLVDPLWAPHDEPFAGLKLVDHASPNGGRERGGGPTTIFRFPFIADADAADRIFALIECILVCYPTPRTPAGADAAANGECVIA